jgi:hypothetical protein
MIGAGCMVSMEALGYLIGGVVSDNTIFRSGELVLSWYPA